MNSSGEKTILKKAFGDAFPVIAGYFPIAIAYGLTARNAGLSFYETVAVSLFVFAGASQFIAAGMIGVSALPLSIVLTVFLVNLRHIAMSLSLRHRFESVPKSLYPFIGFLVTDESFSVASVHRKISAPYFLAMAFPCYLSWVCGSGTGFLVGEFLPAAIAQSAEVTLYAMFAALLVPQIKKYPPAVLIALAAAALYLLLSLLKVYSGVAVLLSAIVTAFAAALIIREDTHSEN